MVTEFVWSEEKLDKSRDNRSSILRIGAVSPFGVDAFWGPIPPYPVCGAPCPGECQAFWRNFAPPADFNLGNFEITSIFCRQRLAVAL